MHTPSNRRSVAPLSSLKSSLIAALLAAMLPALVLGNGSRLPNQNAEATARGNAFVATADNPSAIYYNPAGLTQLSGLQVQFDSYAIFSRYDYTPATGGPAVKADRYVAVIPQLYASFTPENSPLSYGLGFYSPFGQASEWPDNSGFRTIATRSEIIFLTLAPTIAWKFSDSLSIGAGLQINRVETDLASGIAVPGDEFRFQGDDTSFGYNLGLLWKLSERHVFGLNYQSRSTSRFKGDVTLTPFGVSEPGTVSFPFPDIITLGYSWRPTPDWNLEIAIDRTNWDLANTCLLRSAAIPGGVRPIPFEWKASYYYLFGVTHHLADGWRVSAGYSFSENSVPDATFNPAVADMSRHLASLGVGRTFGAVSCFFTYQHGFAASRTVDAGPLNPVNGRYTSVLDAVSLSFRYAF